MAVCPLCGAANQTCGGQTVSGVGVLIGKEMIDMSGPLDDYTVEVNGTETVLRLSKADAEARGLVQPAEEPKPKARAAANKARTSPNKG